MKILPDNINNIRSYHMLQDENLTKIWKNLANKMQEA